MRRLAAESIVLLKNERVLPLEAESLSSVAIIGGNAKAIVLSGGGSASLKPTFFHSPYDGITRALKPSTKLSYVEGARSKLFVLYDPSVLIYKKHPKICPPLISKLSTPRGIEASMLPGMHTTRMMS